jgi:hypothetical protein
MKERLLESDAPRGGKMQIVTAGRGWARAIRLLL